ncbi:MAG TPA: methyltransferase [Labilithrix sp.]|nr:methyltransferase [Labilithrix sp.]
MSLDTTADLSIADVRSVVHRLFIGCAGASLRKEDEQKSREVAALVARLAKVRKGAHLVDAAAGKSSVGLVAAELLPIGRLTVLERDPGRVKACRAAQARLTRSLPIDIRHADIAEDAAWPDACDAVVALHACGPATDLVLEQAIRTRARFIFVVPCCYGDAIPFFAQADAVVRKMGFVADDLIRKRMRASIIDMERKLRLEVAGYETELEELVGATVTPHNLLFYGRQTRTAVRIERAKARLAALHGRG